MKAKTLRLLTGWPLSGFVRHFFLAFRNVARNTGPKRLLLMAQRHCRPG
jgi:hypothetical protein